MACCDAVEPTLPVHQVSPRLSVLTAGRPSSDPMAGLTSDRMQQLAGRGARRVRLGDPGHAAGRDPARRQPAGLDGRRRCWWSAPASTPHAIVQRAAEAIGARAHPRRRAQPRRGVGHAARRLRLLRPATTVGAQVALANAMVCGMSRRRPHVQQGVAIARADRGETALIIAAVVDRAVCLVAGADAWELLADDTAIFARCC